MSQEIAKIYQKERQRFLSYIREKVDNAETAEDILQDAFFHALQGISVTEEIDHLLGWLFTITKNKIIDWYRKKKLPTEQVCNGDMGDWDDLLIDFETHPEKMMFQKIAMETILNAVKELPDKQQMVFIEQMLEGKTLREISDQTGESLNTILSRKRYAIQFLRKRLSDQENLFHEIN